MSTESAPAFPTYSNTRHEGITKRDWFAAMALQGLLAKGLDVVGDRAMSRSEKDNMLAERSYGISDAMVQIAEQVPV